MATDVFEAVAHRCIDACDKVVVCRTFAERFKEHVTISVDFIQELASAIDLSSDISQKALDIFMQELCSFVIEATDNWTKLTHTSSIRDILLMGTEPWRKLSDIDAKLISKLNDLCCSLKFTMKDLSPLAKIGHSISLDIRNAKAIIALDDQNNYLASQLGKLNASHYFQYYRIEIHCSITLYCTNQQMRIGAHYNTRLMQLRRLSSKSRLRCQTKCSTCMGD